VRSLGHKMAALVAAFTLFGSVFLLGGVASAQVGGYPPPTTVPACTPGNVTVGVVAVGQTVTFTLCGGFDPGAQIPVKVNGVVVATKTAVNGAVVVVVTVVSQSVLAVDADAAAVCGTNTVVATGTGTPGTSTGTFTIDCTSSTTSSGGLPLTGANVAELVLIALGLIGAGTVLVVVQRRRRSTI